MVQCHTERRVKQSSITICQFNCALHFRNDCPAVLNSSRAQVVYILGLNMKIYNESLFSQLHLTILLTTVLFAVSTETFDQNTEKKKGPKHILTGHLCTTCFCCRQPMCMNCAERSSPSRSTLSAAQSVSDKFKSENRWGRGCLAS